MNLFEEARRVWPRNVDAGKDCPPLIAWRQRLQELAIKLSASRPPEEHPPARHISFPGIMSD